VRSCAIPTITTPKRSSRSAALKYSRAISSLTSPFTKRATGISRSAMNRSTALTYSPPIRPSTAGEGIGNPRSSRNRIT
jgi:hypothetical protein